MIDLTPVEVRKKKNDFRKAMRGYDSAQVDDFIDLVADRLEQVVREHMALTERVGRQEQQIAEYRERERALTEALVSAQEIREEMRKQATREAEMTKRSAEEETTHVRSSAQQEVTQLRAAAEREAAELRANAERYAAELRATAERDANELRGSAAREREREEELLHKLRAQQQQLLATYRTHLERELQELEGAADTFGVDVTAPPAPPPPPPPPPPTPPAAAPAPPATSTNSETRTASAVIAGGAITLAPATGGEEPLPELAPFDVSGDQGLTSYAPPSPGDSGIDMTPFDASSFGSASFQQPVDPTAGSSSFSAPAIGLRSAFDDERPQTAPFADTDLTAEEPPSFEASYPNAASVAPVEEEPFAPEPFEPEPFEPEDAAEDDPQELPLLSYEDPEPAPVVDATMLYDTIAPAEEDGVPGPIGLAPSQLAWGEDLDTDADEGDEEDEETSRLLRNAAAAGYKLPDDDELLLEEAVEEEAEPGKGGWLPNLLEDES